MLMRSKILVVTILTMLALGLTIITLTNRPAAAQDDEKPAETLHEFVTDLKDSETTVTIEFAIPLITGERVWTLPDARAKREIAVIGADYLCFSEPWNNGARQRCTPFANIVSLTYLTGQ